MAKTDNFVDFLKDMADGIRAKKGTTETINAQDMRSEWEALVGTGGSTTTEPLPGTSVLPENEYCLIVDESGNYDEVDVSGVSCITAKEGVTDISIEADDVSVYLNGGSVSVDNLEPSNVKSGVEILGVTGTLEEGITPTGTKQVTGNGTFDVTDYANVEVAVPSDAKDEQEKTATPTKSVQEITPDDGYALSKVTVEAIPIDYVIPSGTKEIYNNGTHYIGQYNAVEVYVPVPNGYLIPSGTLGIIENGTYDVGKFATVNVHVTSEASVDGVTVDGTTIKVDTDSYERIEVGQSGDDETGTVAICGGYVPVELADEDSSVSVENLEPSNIKSGVTILGVTGTLETEPTIYTQHFVPKSDTDDDGVKTFSFSDYLRYNNAKIIRIAIVESDEDGKYSSPNSIDSSVTDYTLDGSLLSFDYEYSYDSSTEYPIDTAIAVIIYTI